MLKNIREIHRLQKDRFNIFMSNDVRNEKEWEQLIFYGVAFIDRELEEIEMSKIDKWYYHHNWSRKFKKLNKLDKLPTFEETMAEES